MPFDAAGLWWPPLQRLYAAVAVASRGARPAPFLASDEQQIGAPPELEAGQRLFLKVCGLLKGRRNSFPFYLEL